LGGTKIAAHLHGDDDRVGQRLPLVGDGRVMSTPGV
jgi:hypothetical protein